MKSGKYIFGCAVCAAGLMISCAALAVAQEAPPAQPLANASKGTTVNPVDLTGDNVEYKADEGKFIASGNVVLRQDNAVLYCDQIEFYRDQKEAHAMGRVILKSDYGTIWAEKAFYNFATKKGEFTQARIMANPIFGRAETISRVREDYFVLSNGYLTTSDFDVPEWRIRSKHIELFPGIKAVAHNSTMYLGGIPVMHMVKYVQDLRDNKPHLRVIPGYSGEWGAFLLSTYRVYPMDRVEVAYHLDYRERKDLAWGVDLGLRPGQLGQTLIKTYYTNQRQLQPDHIWQERRPPTVERERYRVEWRHQWSNKKDTSLMLQYYKLSDSQILKDFYEREFRQDSNAPSYAILSRASAEGTLTFLAETRTNRFSNPVERLPEVSYVWNNQEIGDTGFYFSSSNSAVNLVQKNPSPSDVGNRTVRILTNNQLSRPFRLAFIDVNPYAGMEGTFYSRALDAANDNSFRGVFRTGSDFSTKFFKVYDVNFDKWGITVNKLRHLVTPTVGYLFQKEPTLESAKLYQFDSNDARFRTNAFALGLENKLQTKRKGKSVDFFRSLLTTSFRLRDKSSNSSFGAVTLDDEFYVNEYVTLGHDITYDNDSQYVSTANYDLTLRDLKKWEFGASSRYTRNDDALVTGQLTYTFNPKWRGVIYNRWNVDTGDWQEQQYSFVRDLHSWEMECSFRDKNAAEQSGAEIWIIFRLKAFPTVFFDGGSNFSTAKPGSQSAR